MTKISTTVTKTVILGSAAYGSPLDITASGTIATNQADQAGIFVPSTLSDAHIQNSGDIIGGIGGPHNGIAGYGINAQSTVSLSNAGTIAGGEANMATNTAEAGGAGVDLRAGGTFQNAGIVTGGNSGDSRLKLPAVGGIGAELHDVAFSNTGTITGGNGGFSNNGTFAAAAGGIGVDLLDKSGGYNKGQITGGYGSATQAEGGTGGAGIQIANAKFSNAGTITGGNGGKFNGEGGIGANLFSGAALANSGTVLGGDAGGSKIPAGAGSYTYTTGNGGTGVSIHGATLTNAGLIVGGAIEFLGFGSSTSADAGAGVFLEGGSVTNTGTIIGGSSSYVGGTGFVLMGGVATSTGSISGGTNGGDGNADVAGGFGVVIDSGTFIASGTISGGGSGFDPELGGAGVQINGGTLVAAGVITGGTVYDGPGPTSLNDAVAFGTLAGTLILHPTAIFNGQVAATAGAGDALELAGTAAGTLNGFGTQFTGFDTLTVEANARWSLTGTSALSLDLPVTDNGQLTLATAISGTGGIALGTGATLTANQSDTGIGVTFGGPGHLNLAAPATFAATITAFGSGDVIDLEHLHATTATFAAGTLTLQNGTSTVGSLAFAGTFTSNNFSLSSDAHGGTNITFLATHAAILPDFTALLTHSPLGHPTASPPDAHARFSTELAHADLLTIGHPSSHTT